jgi:hypothetical protein
VSEGLQVAEGRAPDRVLKLEEPEACSPEARAGPQGQEERAPVYGPQGERLDDRDAKEREAEETGKRQAELRGEQQWPQSLAPTRPPAVNIAPQPKRTTNTPTSAGSAALLGADPPLSMGWAL